MTSPISSSIILPMRKILTTIRRRFFLALLLIGLILAVTWEWPDPTDENIIIRNVVQNQEFDFVGWEIDSLAAKALYSLAPPNSYLPADAEKSIVLEYFDLVRQAQQLERSIAEIYADPSIPSPETAAVEKQGQFKSVRSQINKIQPLAEGVIQDQIGEILAESGIDTAGRSFPPVELHFTPLPSMLVISPRQRVEAIHFYSLKNGVETADRVKMEEEIDSRLDVSSLVVDIGGLAAYPAMMLESSSLNWVIETGAHEWTHHYLTLHPLGILYDTDPQLRTMNETTASIVGTEIGEKVVDRFYPEYSLPKTEESAGQVEQQEPPAFDFRAEMHQTRLQVDELLAQNKVEKAEVYMEERRLFFWENGYHIRKINQAYFAFYGAYADEAGAAGQDPVGPAVVALRNQSDSIQTFLETMAGLTSYDDLAALIKGQR